VTSHAPMKSKHDVDRIFLVCAFILISAAKSIIIAGNEIVSEGSDSVEYLLIAKSWFWGSSQPPIRGPGFPLFVALNDLLGLRLRSTSEFLFMLASAWFCYGLLLMKLPAAVIAIVFFALVFHPLTFLNLDMPMSEGLFVILMFVALGALIRVILSESPRSRLLNGAILGVTSALMIHTRASDRYIIYFTIAEVLICAYVLQALRERKLLVVNGLVTAGAVVLPVALINLLVFGANYAAFGNFGYNDIVGASRLRLIQSLMMIDAQEAPLHPRVLITTKARQIAYRLSPTLRAYEAEIEGPYLREREESNYGTFSRTGLKGQLDTEDTMGLITNLCAPFQIAFPEDRVKSKQHCDERLDRISDELRQALRSGLAKRRIVFHVFNPSFEMLTTNASASLAKFLQSFFAYADAPIQNYYPFYGTLFADLYDAMANRDRAVLMKGPLEGFLSVPKGETVKSVRFVNDAADFMRQTGGDPQPFPNAFDLMRKQGFAVYEDMGAAQLSAPIDDPAAIPSVLNARAGERSYIVKFRVPAVHDRVFLHFTKLVVTLGSGAQHTIKELEQGLYRESSAIREGERPGVLKCFITAFDLSLTPAQKVGYEVQGRIFGAFNANSKNFAIALGVMSTITFGIAVWITFRRRAWSSLDVGVLCVCAILISLLFGRLVFYALVDSTIFPINTQRHLFAASIILFPVILIVGAASAVSIARKWHA
jgi:hypothetical protein